MSLETRKILRRSVGIVLSVLLVVTGVLLLISCVRLYRSGDAPFTRESVGAALRQLAVPLVLSVLGVIAAGVLALVLPVEEVKLRAKMTDEATLARLTQKVGTNEAARKEARVRFTLRAGLVISLVAAVVFSLLCTLNVLRNEAASYNATVLAATVWTAVPFALAGIYAVWISWLCQASVKREIAILRGDSEKSPQTVRECPLCGFLSTHKKQAMLALRCTLLAVAAVLIVVGILNGGMADVLGKAINICTECIGLG